jgi:hypothetical protein
MQNVAKFFAENWFVVSVANIGGIIGLGVFTWAVIRALSRFIRDAWQNNVRVAIYRIKKSFLEDVISSATDIHIFIANIARYAAKLFAGLLAVMYCLSLIAVPKEIYTRDFGAYGGLAFNVVQYLNSSLTVFLAILIFLRLTHFMKFLDAVEHRRVRKIR